MEQRCNELVRYFEDLAERHEEIVSFCRYELDELLDKTANISGFPALVLEGFDFDYGSSQPDNVLKERNGAFCVLDVCDGFDAEKRMQVLEHNERIAEDILLKMINDKRERHPLLAAFEISSAKGGHFLNPAFRYALCRVSFSFKTKVKENRAVWK